jgi:hypothetical protein
MTVSLRNMQDFAFSISYKKEIDTWINTIP